MPSIDSIFESLGAGAVVVALSISCAAKNPPGTIPEKIPASVSAKFQEFVETYFGATLTRCAKGNRVVYRISSSGTLNASEFYTGTGVHIGSVARGDEVSADTPRPKPPIDLSQYICKDVYTSALIAEQNQR